MTSAPAMSNNVLTMDDSDGSDGSDSDATTTSSTEHLMTREEKLYVLRHTPRQEPQGQESKGWQQHHQRSESATGIGGCRSCHRSGSVNRLMESGQHDQLAASCRTLIIHGSLSDESWARDAGSIPDLGGLSGSSPSAYLTSTPNAKGSVFRPADDGLDEATGTLQPEDLLLLGSADRRRRRGHVPSIPSSAAAASSLNGQPSFTTRSLPRSAKDFSTLYRPAASPHLTSLASLYQEEQEAEATDHHAILDVASCERRQQLKMLQGLAREMNWSLPVDVTATPGVIYPSLSDETDVSATGVCSALSMSDTLLLNEHQTSVQQQTPSSISTGTSYTKDFTYLSKPPPAYPRNINKTVPNPSTTNTNNETADSNSSSCRRIKIRRALSRSHPDLYKLGKELSNSGSGSNNTTIWRALRQNKADPSIAGIPSVSNKVDESGNSNKKNESFGVDPAGQYPPVPSANGQQQSDANAVAPKSDNNQATVDDKGVWSTTELVDAILEENFKLRQQVQSHQHNIAKLQKFEEELSSVHAAHQALMRSSERKESLERSARIRLQEINVGLRNQVDLLSTQLALRSSTPGSMSGSVSSTINSDHHPGGIDWQAQVARRDALIAQLVSQNKELMVNKERQDIELCAQKATLQQQRSHIEILESALSRSQIHANRLEEEYRRQCNETGRLFVTPSKNDSSSRLMAAGDQSNGNPAPVESAAAQRERVNMEIRIRDLEAKLSEKEMLIHLLQRASMDRELAFSTGSNGSGRLPDSVSMLHRLHPLNGTGTGHQQHHSSQHENITAGGSSNKGIRSSSTSGVSSLPGSSRGSAVSVASNSPTRTKLNGVPSTGTGPSANGNDGQHTSVASQALNETAQTLDNQLRALDRFYQNKQSLIQALQSDKERFPNNYWAS